MKRNRKVFQIATIPLTLLLLTSCGGSSGEQVQGSQSSLEDSASRRIAEAQSARRMAQRLRALIDHSADSSDTAAESLTSADQRTISGAAGGGSTIHTSYAGGGSSLSDPSPDGYAGGSNPSSSDSTGYAGGGSNSSDSTTNGYAGGGSNLSNIPNEPSNGRRCAGGGTVRVDGRGTITGSEPTIVQVSGQLDYADCEYGYGPVNGSLNLQREVQWFSNQREAFQLLNGEVHDPNCSITIDNVGTTTSIQYRPLKLSGVVDGRVAFNCLEQNSEISVECTLNDVPFAHLASVFANQCTIEIRRN